MYRERCSIFMVRTSMRIGYNGTGTGKCSTKSSAIPVSDIAILVFDVIEQKI